MNTKILKQKILAKLLINDEWKTVKLGEICEVTSSKRIYQSEYVNDGVSFYRTKEVVELNNNQSISTVLFISEKRYNEIKNQFGVPQENDILISAVGTIGISWIVDKRKFYFKDGNLLWLRKINENSKFIKFFLDSIFCDNSFGHGGAYNALTIEKLKQFSIPLPPLSVQKSIVDRIERLFAEIDRIETAQQELLQLVKTAKQKTLQLAITGELTNADTSTWKTVKLGGVCDYGKCKTVKNANIPNDAWILDLEDIEKDTGKLLQRSLKAEKNTTSVRHSFKKSEVLYSKLRTYLNKVLVADMDGFCTTEIIPINFKGKVIPEFARFVLMSPMFLEYTEQCGYGVKMPRLGTNDAKRADFPLPPLSVQQQIVSKIEAIFTEIETIEKLIRY